MKKMLSALAALSAQVLCGQDALKQQVKTTRIELVALSAGGTIHIEGSYGYLTVEGWDQPEVEIVVTKSRAHYGDSATLVQDEKRLESIRMESRRGSPADLTISCTLAARHGARFRPLPRATTNGVTTQYMIRAPRDSHLVIHHGVGYVEVAGMTGDIEATGHRGDIVLMLPESGSYSIDAKSKIGPVLSDFAGRAHVRGFVGETFATSTPAFTRRVHLRLGFGSITIKRAPPEGY
jgi:hypothetical protein